MNLLTHRCLIYFCADQGIGDLWDRPYMTSPSLWGGRVKNCEKNDDAKKLFTGGREGFKKSGKIVVLGSFKNFKLVDTILEFCHLSMILEKKKH